MLLDQTEQQGAPIMQVKDWLIVFLISALPIINIVMLFVWAFSGNSVNPNKSNFAKAGLLWFAIIMGLYIVLGVVFGLGAFLLSDAY